MVLSKTQFPSLFDTSTDFFNKVSIKEGSWKSLYCAGLQTAF